MIHPEHINHLIREGEGLTVEFKELHPAHR